jgi:hypothetical protein
MSRVYKRCLIGEESLLAQSEWAFDASELDLGIDVPWSVEKWTLRGGRQEGVELVEIDNGRMSIVVCPTRGMGVIEAWCDDVMLGWQSPVREIVHPAFLNLPERGGLGWLGGFNEWICRCGLESHGAPVEDVVLDNQGTEMRTFLPLHGRIANLPASSVWLSVDLDPPHRLRLIGEVEEAMMFGPALRLTSMLETELGAASFRIVDTVENLRSVPQEMQLLYHANFGAPLLEEGAELLIPFHRMAARDQRALEGLEMWNRFGAAEAGFREQCYFFQPAANRRHQSTAALVHPGGETAASVTFDTRTLPWFTLWKCTGDPRDGYVTGLEPGTSLPNGRRFEREKRRVRTLDPGESVRTDLTFSVHTSRAEVGRLRKRIERIQKSADGRVESALDAELSP